MCQNRSSVTNSSSVGSRSSMRRKSDSRQRFCSPTKHIWESSRLSASSWATLASTIRLSLQTITRCSWWETFGMSLASRIIATSSDLTNTSSVEWRGTGHQMKRTRLTGGYSDLITLRPSPNACSTGINTARVTSGFTSSTWRNQRSAFLHSKYRMRTIYTHCVLGHHSVRKIVSMTVKRMWKKMGNPAL